METLVGVHHFYGGIGLAVLGYLMVAWGRRRALSFGLVIAIAGTLIMADDIWQHSVQHVRHDNYDSPCKRVFKYLSPRCPVLHKTVSTADRFFRQTGPEEPESDK